MNKHYKIVDEIRELLVAAEIGEPFDEDFDYDAYIAGLQAAYNIASEIADGFR